MDESAADNPRVEQDPADVDLSEETQDWRFVTQLTKSSSSGGPPQIPKRGEKDFEPDGTNLQRNVLDDARQAMFDVLGGERRHTAKMHIEGVWHREKQLTEIKIARGAHFKTIGKADKKGVLWLLPEETLYMVERGNLECWWEEGVPMSVQGVYAACLEAAGGLERFQVYSFLKRAGYIIQRAPTFDDEPAPKTDRKGSSSKAVALASQPVIRASTAQSPGLFRQLFTNLFAHRPSRAGPLIPTSVHRSYATVYASLSLIPSHHPPTTPQPLSNGANTAAPYRITYHVWKPSPNFKKSAPGTPDFRIAVVNARTHGMPTLQELAALMECVPVNETLEGRNMFVKLKEGYRSVILAVVDSGVTSFLKFGDAGFADQVLFERPPRGWRGGKMGGRGGRGKGGRGGRRGQGGRS